jgi:hypothetical protein
MEMPDGKTLAWFGFNSMFLFENEEMHVTSGIAGDNHFCRWRKHSIAGVCRHGISLRPDPSPRPTPSASCPKTLKRHASRPPSPPHPFDIIRVVLERARRAPEGMRGISVCRTSTVVREFNAT